MKSFMRSLGRQEQIGKYMKLLVYFCSLFDLWNNLLFSTGRVSLQSHYSDDGEPVGSLKRDLITWRGDR